jgi:aminoglycoside phosphotransferase
VAGVAGQARHQLRAVGRRVTYVSVPLAVRAQIAERFGKCDVLREHVGGLSPGCATSLRTPEGQVVFVKAVGMELNEQTVELFRREAGLLRVLAPAEYRPRLLADFEVDGWVALVLEHVEGRHPHLDDADDFAAVAQVITGQVTELTPPPKHSDVLSMVTTAERWASRWEAIAVDPQKYLPAWAIRNLTGLLDRVRRLPDELTTTTLCHFDVRDDNLLLTDDGRAMVLDWGMARLGPAWTDLVVLAAQRSTAEESQSWLERWVPPDEHDLVTSFLIAFGGSQAWNARQPAIPSLPGRAAFCAEDSLRLLSIARRRLAS